MKRYLITGASRGIGRAIAMKLASPDVMLLLHGRDTVALAETCRAVEKSGGKTAKLIHDLANFRGIDDLVAEVGHKPIDLLVNNAGIAVVKPFAEITRRGMGANHRRKRNRAFFPDPTFCAADAAGLEHRQYFVHRRENRLSKLERVLRGASSPWKDCPRRFVKNFVRAKCACSTFTRRRPTPISGMLLPVNGHANK